MYCLCIQIDSLPCQQNPTQYRFRGPTESAQMIMPDHQRQDKTVLPIHMPELCKIQKNFDKQKLMMTNYNPRSFYNIV
jgi:hypothetical protein